MSTPSSGSLRDSTSRFSERKAVVVLLDIVGTTKIITALAPLHFAAFLDDFYRLCAHHVEHTGGEVVKYPGDAALAMFDAEGAVAAVEAVHAIREGFKALCATCGVQADIGANIHLGDVVDGVFGPTACRDITGSAVYTTFRMGGGPGLRISEPVYRKLPSGARSPWKKQKAQVTYMLP
jgi:class 3 adenylate cyclase